jgi:hypothetical protein
MKNKSIWTEIHISKKEFESWVNAIIKQNLKENYNERNK